MTTAEMAGVDTAEPSQLPQHKVKTKLAFQRACNEKDTKGKICAGHLKRWAYWRDVLEQECGDVEREWGRGREVYRCEHCKTLYLPNPDEPRRNNAGPGLPSEFGLTLPPKTDQPGTNTHAAGADLEKQVAKALPDDTVEQPKIQPEPK